MYKVNYSNYMYFPHNAMWNFAHFTFSYDPFRVLYSYCLFIAMEISIEEMSNLLSDHELDKI